MCSKISCSIEVIFFFDYNVITKTPKMGLKTELIFILNVVIPANVCTHKYGSNCDLRLHGIPETVFTHLMHLLL